MNALEPRFDPERLRHMLGHHFSRHGRGRLDKSSAAVLTYQKACRECPDRCIRSGWNETVELGTISMGCLQVLGGGHSMLLELPELPELHTPQGP